MMRLIISNNNNTSKQSTLSKYKKSNSNGLHRSLTTSSTRSSTGSTTAASIVALASSSFTLSSNNVAAFSSIVVPTVHRYSTGSRSYEPMSSLSSPPSLSRSNGRFMERNQMLGILPKVQQQTTVWRHYSSRRNPDNDKNNTGIVTKGINVVSNIAKSILPTSWFRTEEEKQQAMKRQEIKDTVSNTVNELFRNTPMPVRMIGKSIVSPLISNIMSGLSETMSQQQSLIDTTLDSVLLILQNDSQIQQLFNNEKPIIGTPFSQSSSSVSINGQMTNTIQLSFPITSSFSSSSSKQCIGHVSSSNGIINTLFIDINGQRIPINTSINSIGSSSNQKSIPNTNTYVDGMSSSSRSKSYVNNDNKYDNIIEAEIIEKKTKK